MLRNSMKKILFSVTALFAVVSLVAAGCSDDNDNENVSSADKPSIVVTTNILGDVVSNMVGDSFNVEVIMPPGSDPHDFQASAQQVEKMMSADLLIVNGANFEEGMLSVIESAEADGVMVFEAISVVSQLEGSDDHGHDDHEGHDDHDDHEGHDDHDDHEGHDDHDDHEGHDDHEDHDNDDHDDHEGHDDHDDHKDHDDHEGHDDHDDHKDHDDHEGHDDHDDHEGHDDHDDHKDHDDHEGHDDHDDHEGHDHDHEGHDDHDDHEGHDHGGIDPHFFTDPARMAVVVEELSEFLVANFPNVDQGFVSTANDYAQELIDLDEEVNEILSEIPQEGKVLVTNHAVFAYFADSYGFEILGEIIPSASTLSSANAQQLASLADELSSNSVKAIFADASASDTLARTLAAEVGDIEVITLFTESLGEPGSSGANYIEMVKFNAQAIASGLVG